jgi:hypothetical protein
MSCKVLLHNAEFLTNEVKCIPPESATSIGPTSKIKFTQQYLMQVLQIVNLIQISSTVSGIKHRAQHNITIMHPFYVFRAEDTQKDFAE